MPEAVKKTMRFDSLLKRLKRGKLLEVIEVLLKVLVPRPLPLHRFSNLPLAKVLVGATDTPRDCVGKTWLHGVIRSKLLNLK